MAGSFDSAKTGTRNRVCGWTARPAVAVVVTVVVVVVVVGLGGAGVEGKVRLVEQGYEGVVIVIGHFIPQDNAMLHRLKQYLTAMSRTLFRATRNLLYFREFVIVIPETWKGVRGVENTLEFPMDLAQIIIDQPNLAYGDAPYVKQYAECGQPGLYIHLTPSYLKDDDVVNKWGPPEKTLVHEWAHLRWGLFDEYPIDPEDAEFYRHEGAWHPTRCTAEVDGSIHNKFTSKDCAFNFFTGQPEKNCLFFPKIKSNKASASLMFMQYLESIVEFCDDPVTSAKPLRHNNLAPNRQNRLCAYRSAWEVMRKHEDFRKVKPLSDDTDTTPVFRIVQIKPKKRVLVLDTSGSMTGSSLSVMMQATSSYILSCLETGSSLGIVQFNTNASVLSPMVDILSEDDRHTLIRRLPRTAEGKTSIGAGLEKGLQLLNSMRDKRNDQGSIILITDGKENERPFLTDFQPKILSKGVVVHSLSYGQRAEQSIAQLSRRTGGKLFFYSGRKDSTALIDGLAATLRGGQGSSLLADLPVSIMTTAQTVFTSTSSPLSGTFVVDSTVGRDTSLTVTYSNRVSVSVISPSDVTMTSASHPRQFRDEQDSGVLKILLPGSAEIGKWTYVIETNESESDVTVNVQSKSRTPETKVLQVTSWLSWLPENNTVSYDKKQKITVFAELVQGRSPVLNADITAVLERPQSAKLNVPLRDNGMGSDIIKGDGVYSAFVLASDMKGNGRYNVKIQARGAEGSAQLVVGGKGAFSGALGPAAAGESKQPLTKGLETFERVTSAGEFRVDDYPERKDKGGAGRGAAGEGRKEQGKEEEEEEEEGEEDSMAPSRITDLNVVRFDPNSGEAVVRWTAVGDDLDRGTVSSYVMQVSQDFDALFTLSLNHTAWTHEDGDWNLGDAPRTPRAPRTAGETEHAQLTLRRLGENATLFLAVRALDEGGNSGELSNVVTLSRARVLAVPIRLAHPGYSPELYLRLIVPPLAALLLFVAFGVLVVRCQRWRRGSDGKAVEEEEVGGKGAGGRVESLSVSGLTLDLDLGVMNYRHEGQYRPRHVEQPEMWNPPGWSRDKL
ncbi:calcium-activated chloride channel regulator 4-like [Babylonia areolata]|uniref:calcium-activated chloride channel regulator 4-like n=1 Tax=Babylonia areolata TaxID=304850 RepID=UPI003FD542C3